MLIQAFARNSLTTAEPWREKEGFFYLMLSSKVPADRMSSTISKQARRCQPGVIEVMNSFTETPPTRDTQGPEPGWLPCPGTGITSSNHLLRYRRSAAEGARPWAPRQCQEASFQRPSRLKGSALVVGRR